MNSSGEYLSIRPVEGSFRDPCNRVYRVQGDAGGTSADRILRGCNQEVAENFEALRAAPFFKAFQENCSVIKTWKVNDEAVTGSLIQNGWASVLEHAPIPFVSYPYEWSYSMLRDAALLHLELLEVSLENGWTIKDSTPYNIQWFGSRPVFIDVPSFEPWQEGESWLGYRQFCNMFLTPLLIRKHLGISHNWLLRANIDGIPPVEAAKYFYGMACFRKGVPSHILLPAKVENRIAMQERDNALAQRRAIRKQSKAMVIGLIQSMQRLISKLDVPVTHTDWSQYENTHTYDDVEFQTKQEFVQEFSSKKKRNHIWDIGCNTGTYSRLVSESANYVVALDGDHDAVELLYLREKHIKGERILPLVMNLANMSPDHGWAGTERAAFDNRTKPDLILCLALIHHMRLSANIPNSRFLDWLHSTGADVILEFVDRHDEMVIKLLTNKKEQYSDYTLQGFLSDLSPYFKVCGEQELKGGKRRIYYLEPKR